MFVPRHPYPFVLSIVLGLLCSLQARANCKVEYIRGGLFGGATETLTYTDETGTKTIKVGRQKPNFKDFPNNLLCPLVEVENYDGTKKDIEYKDYEKDIEQCKHANKWPDWFSPSNTNSNLLPEKRQETPIPVVTASQLLDVGYLNGDDGMDVVGIRFFQGAAVSLRASDGSVPRLGVVYATGPGPESLQLADVNGDEQPDLLVANQGDFRQDPGNIAVLIGFPDGTFAPAVNYPAGMAPRSVFAADVTGDGRVDLVVASIGSLGAPNLPADDGNVFLLPGNGDGTFQAARVLLTGNSPSSVIVAEFNGDGKPDVAVTNQGTDSLSVLMGNGDGTFQPAVHTQVGDRPGYLGSADFNGDGAADLAVLHPRSATISVWVNSGGGAFAANGRYLAGVSQTSFAIEHNPEEDRPTIFSGDRAATRYLFLPVNLNGSLVAPPAYAVGANPSAVAVADFDGNGDLDLAVASNKGVELLRDVHPRRFPQAVAEPARPGDAQRATSVATGDFDGDGRPDIAVARSSRIEILSGVGDGTFRAPVAVSNGGSPNFLAARDLNGDQRLDLIAVNGGGPQGSVSVHLATAAGGFTSAEYAAGVSPLFVTTGDFNGDDRPDLAVANFGNLTDDSPVSLLLANANGTFQASRQVTAGLSINTVASGDFNGDGKTDLASAGQLTRDFVFGVAIQFGNGDGTFQAPLITETSFGPNYMLAHDSNGDGLLDLSIAHCCGTTDLSELLGNGDGTFRRLRYPGGESPKALAAADFDRDGTLDLAVVDDGSLDSQGVVSILDSGMQPFENVSAATGSPSVVAPDSIVSAYGVRFTAVTAAAPSPQWPETLGGVRVRVRDAAGVERNARIAFVSFGQINYHMPAETAEGTAIVTITSGDDVEVSAPVQVQRVAPGLFSATPDGLAAAWVIRVKATGEQILEPVVRLNNAGQIVAAPIDLGEESDIVILQLFGTGLRFRSALGDVKVFLNSTEGIVHYAGPQNEFPGLDQVNIEIPKSLRGAGPITVELRIGDRFANRLRVQIL